MATLTITIPDELYERLKFINDASDSSLDDTIVAGLDRAYPRDEWRARTRIEIEEERRKVREALKDIVITLDWDEYHCGSRQAPMSDAEREAVLKTLPILDPPMSQIIIEDREDRI